MTSRPAEMPFSEETRKMMTDALIFEPPAGNRPGDFRLALASRR